MGDSGIRVVGCARVCVCRVCRVFTYQQVKKMGKERLLKKM